MAAGFVVAACRPAFAAPPLLRPEVKQRLQFLNIHTGEKLDVLYQKGDEYLPSALADIAWILRDWRVDKVKAVDVRLLEILAQLRTKLNAAGAIQIISGYRTPQTNAMLHQKSRGVASHSLHIEAKAIDLRFEDRSIGQVFAAAQGMQKGGCGIYPTSGFVHVDCGKVRTWRGA